MLIYSKNIYIFAKQLQQNNCIKIEIMKTLKERWSERLAKLQRINNQNERFNIGSNHCHIRFRLTQLAIKFKL